MPRPTTNSQLITASENEYKKLNELINSMSIEEQKETFKFEDRDRNVRDVLVHLYEWHQMLLNWVDANTKGDPKPFLPAPYNWKTYGAMNVEVIWKKHQNTPYDKSREMLSGSHAQVMKLAHSFTDEELFTKKHYNWIGSSSLGAYFVSATSSHYDWAIRKLKNHIKTYREVIC